MKNTIALLIIFTCSLYSFAQVKVISGYQKETGEFVQESESTHLKSAVWFESKDHKYLFCKTTSNRGSIELLNWHIKKIIIEGSDVSYHLKSGYGQTQLATVKKGSKQVFLLTVSTNEYSLMTGTGINVEDL